MRKNKLVVFEGVDGAGKATQVKLLARKLRADGRAVSVFDIPNYASVPGKFILECLAGKHGDFVHMDPYMASLPYALDRALLAPRIRRALERGIVICNRYTTSNVAFQGAKLKVGEFKKFKTFIEELEYSELGVPRPDTVVHLAPPLHVAAEQLKRSGKKLDQNEKDASYQKTVALVYGALAREKGWVTVACKAGEDPAAVHERVWKALRRKIG